MASFTMQLDTPASWSVSHAHAGGPVTIAASQRGVVFQFTPTTSPGLTAALHNNEGRNPVNQGSFELAAGTIKASVGRHTFGNNGADIIVDIT